MNIRRGTLCAATVVWATVVIKGKVETAPGSPHDPTTPNGAQDSSATSSKSSVSSSIERASRATWPTYTDGSSGHNALAAASKVLLVGRTSINLYDQPNSEHPVGSARIGAVLPSVATNRRCKRGQWFQVSGDAFACVGRHTVVKSVEQGKLPTPPPRIADRTADLSDIVPYHYVKASNPNTPRFNRLPTEAQLDKLLSGSARTTSHGGLVHRWMKGAYFLAVVNEHQVGDYKMYETSKGRFVAARQVETKRASSMHGVTLGKDRSSSTGVRLPRRRLVLFQQGQLAQVWSHCQTREISPGQVNPQARAGHHR